MNLALSSAIIKKSLIAFLHRFHVTLFAVTVLGGIIVIVWLLNSVVVRSGDTGDYTPNISDASFDQATINKIKQLKTRDQNSGQLDLSGRANPFVE
jgi:hypothetical protein